MNGHSGSLVEIEAMRLAPTQARPARPELVVSPPATLLAQAAFKLRGSKLGLGAQDCHPEASGAFTGDIFRADAEDAGAPMSSWRHSSADHFIIGPDALVRAKAEATLEAGSLRSSVSARRG